MEKLLDYFIPEKYDLELCLWRHDEKTKGRVIITGEWQKGHILLHAVGLKISQVEWEPGRDEDYDLPGFAACEFKHDGEILDIPVSPEMQQTLSESTETHVTLKINFEGTLNHNMQGCYLSTYQFAGKEQRLITTQFESHYARESFPCLDEPAAKAVFDLTLILPDYNPAFDVVLANTPVIGQVNGKFTFASTPRMSTYLLAWVAGPLQGVSTVNRNGVKVSSYCALNQPVESLLFANDTAAKALEYYDEKFRERYPLPKLDQVALPDFEAGAMENWGLVTYRESMMLADRTATIDTKRSVATTVTHELSHQWFGDLVTMEWWDDLWLNESFATVIEYFATDALYPDFNIWEDFFTGECLAALKRDCLPGVQAIKQEVHHPAEIATLFDGAIVYAKGARLILMLIRMLGEEKFDAGIRDYFDKYKYQNTVGDNLWSSLQPYADFDVAKFMHAWISQPGYPLVTFDGWQKRFLINGDSADDEEWPLPKIIDDMSGHYLIKLDDEEFRQKLAKFDTLSLEQRLRLMIDRMLLAKTPTVPADSLLDLLPRFSREQSAAVWSILALIIGDLKLFCPPESAAADDYKQYLQELLQSEFDAIDYSALIDVDVITRRDYLLSVARYCEYQPVLRRLADLYQDDLSQLSPELRSHIMLAKLFFDEQEVFPTWLEKYSAETNPEIKADLLCILASHTREPEYLAQLIGLLDQPQIVRPQDHIFLYIYLLRNYRTREQVLDWLLEHWSYVEQLTGDKSIEDYPRYAAALIRTPAEADKFYAFFDPKASDPVLRRTITVAHVEIDSRLQLIADDTNGVQDKLKQLMKGA